MVKPASEWDPWKYKGPLRRLDGVRAYNHYFWPMAGDDWWVRSSSSPAVQRMVNPDRIAIIALADGRWSTEGATYHIEENRHCYGGPCVFDTREAALRSAIARFIWTCRKAVKWDGSLALRRDTAAEAINWALDILQLPHISVPPAPQSPKAKTGLPLFDMETANG